jgi:hypothetical protein
LGKPTLTGAPESAKKLAIMSAPAPKMMLGFVVRRCTVALGHSPSPAEFAEWANRQCNDGEPYCLFGRPITEREAALILRHPGRPVSARSATAQEQLTDAKPATPNVVAFNPAAKRRAAQPARTRRLGSRLRRS